MKDFIEKKKEELEERFKNLARTDDKINGNPLWVICTAEVELFLVEALQESRQNTLEEVEGVIEGLKVDQRMKRLKTDSPSEEAWRSKKYAPQVLNIYDRGERWGTNHGINEVKQAIKNLDEEKPQPEKNVYRGKLKIKPTDIGEGSKPSYFVPEPDTNLKEGGE